MVEITKGSMTLTVPRGAYDNQYAPAGWEMKSNNKSSKPSEQPKAKVKEPEEVAEEDSEDVEDVEDTEEDVEYIEVDPEELLEKPLEELDFEELKIVADYLGLDTKGMTTSKAIRSAIKKANK